MIELKHSSIVIHNYRGNGKLERILSVWDEATFSVTWRAYFHDEENERLILPRGFDVNYLSYLFPDKEVFINRKSDESRSAIFKMTTEPRNETQERAIQYLLGEGEFSDLSSASQKLLCLKTGEGKTFCLISSLASLKKRAMIIVDKDKIMKQWKEEFLKFTNLNEKEIYLVSGSNTIKRIMSSNRDMPYKIYIASHRTLDSYANDDWERITEFFKKIQIGVKAFDEAHVEVKNIFMVDSFTNVSNTFYLTATPGRSNPNENKVYENMFKKTPRHGLEEKFDDPYHYIYYISYDSKPSIQTVTNCSNVRGFDINRFSDYTFDERYDQFIDVITKILDIAVPKADGKIAITVHKNKHIKKLASTLSKIYPTIEIGTFSGVIKNKDERDIELNKKIIISTNKSLGKAIDVEGLQFLIQTVPFSSKITSEQVMGRLRKIEGKKSFYFDITDVGFGACKNQRFSRRAILDKKAKKIKILKL